MRFGTSIGFLAGVAILASTAQADLLNLWPQNPDITSSFITVTYNSGTDQFNANGTATQLVDELNNVYNITGGSFALNATIDSTGTASAGSLTIGGNVNGDGPSLLTGSLVDFGYDTGGSPIFEFIFKVTGGDLATAFGGINKLVGVILDGGLLPSYNGTFTNGFVATAALGNADTFIVPAPSSVTLAFFGVLAISGLAHRRRRPATIKA